MAIHSVHRKSRKKHFLPQYNHNVVIDTHNKLGKVLSREMCEAVVPEYEHGESHLDPLDGWTLGDTRVKFLCETQAQVLRALVTWKQ